MKKIIKTEFWNGFFAGLTCGLNTNLIILELPDYLNKTRISAYKQGYWLAEEICAQRPLNKNQINKPLAQTIPNYVFANCYKECL